MQQSITNLLKRLWQHLNPRRKTQFWLLLILMLFASFAEIISIGSVFPFLAALTSPDHIFSNPLVRPVIDLIGLTNSNELLFPLTFIFCCAIVVVFITRSVLILLSTKLSFSAGADLSVDIYRRILFQPYAEHCARNSSEIINGISIKANDVTYGIIVPFLTLISSSFLLTAILIALLVINPLVALSTFGGFGLIYIFIIRLTRQQLLTNSQCVAKESSSVIKCLQEGLGGIRDVLIDGAQLVYCNVYNQADKKLRRAQGNSLFISQIPRYGIEVLGMLIIAILAYVLASDSKGISSAIPILGVLVLSAQRLLPLMQQAYASWVSITSKYASLQDTIEFLDQPIPDYLDQVSNQKLPFEYQINIRNVDFRYSHHMPYIFRNLNLKILKGSRVGFVGPTGCGKSTLLDIVMGLLDPIHGEIQIDGQAISAKNKRAWQANISHVPQVIFLSDTSIEENIAFGIPKNRIDSDLVRKVAKQAQIDDLIESWPHKYKTLVGERGIRLSGGQRQRIGIARALYKKADVIIFDEATSALDSETENGVMQAIEKLGQNITILIVAHRVTTLKKCTQIVELSDGYIKSIGNYQEIIGGDK